MESINHVLFECSSAKVVWDDNEFGEIFVVASQGRFEDRLKWGANNLSINEVRSIMTIA